MLFFDEDVFFCQGDFIVVFVMEAVELARPAAEAVAAEVSKILSVEGFGLDGGGGSAEKRQVRGKDPVFGRLQGITSADIACKVTASDSRSQKVDTGLCMFHNSLPTYVDESTTKDAKPLFISRQLQRKAEKTPKSSSYCSKRPRSEHIQGFMNQAVSGDCNVPTGKHRSTLTECSFAERSAVGQKNCLDGKRADKRNSRPPTKTKVDPFFSKTGMGNPSLSAGGGSILGIYGLKSDIHDVTKHVDELSLNDLLDGSYTHPSLCRDKGKKGANTNDNLVHTMRNACSILQPWKSVQSQNGPELDSSSSRKMDTSILSSGSVAGAIDSIKGDDYMADLASSNKDTSTEVTNSPLCHPRVILERLALPPPKDVETLLLDTAKPALSRGMNGLRLPKPISCGSSLPPFPWSHCSNGPSKIIVDTGKLSSNRSRWVRIGNMVSSVGGASNFIDLDSVTSDHKNSAKRSNASSLHNTIVFALPQRRPGSSDWQLKLGPSLQNPFRAPKAEGGHSPRLLAAAQTLYEILQHSAVQNHNSGNLRWPKKPSQKAMKARKPRSTGKTEVLSSTPRLGIGLSDQVETMDKSTPSKKQKHFTNNKKIGVRHTNHSNHVERGQVKWSCPTSSRSPPSRSENIEGKHSNSDYVKPRMIPPIKRSLDRTWDNELRKAVSMDWGRGWTKNDS